MAETPQQYTQRILTTLGDRDPVNVLQETPAKLAELVKSQPASTLNQRPAPGKWSVGEILAHLADAEMVVGFRVRLILGHPGVPIQAFDQDVWAAFSHYEQIPAPESLERFTAQRRANVRLLRSLSPEQMQQHGMHSERGRETVEQVIKMWAGHDLNHRAQVERILGKSAAA
ncbi:MAG: DinB family protein [Terriglobales bacterium]